MASTGVPEFSGAACDSWLNPRTRSPQASRGRAAAALANLGGGPGRDRNPEAAGRQALVPGPGRLWNGAPHHLALLCMPRFQPIRGLHKCMQVHTILPQTRLPRLEHIHGLNVCMQLKTILPQTCLPSFKLCYIHGLNECMQVHTSLPRF